MSKLIRIGSFPHLSAISKESMAEKIVELEKRNKKLESANDDLEAENKNLKKLIAKCKCLTHAEYRDWNREQSK